MNYLWNTHDKYLDFKMFHVTLLKCFILHLIHKKLILLSGPNDAHLAPPPACDEPLKTHLFTLPKIGMSKKN